MVFYQIKEQNQPIPPPLSRPEPELEWERVQNTLSNFLELEEETRVLELGAILELGVWVFLVG